MRHVTCDRADPCPLSLVSTELNFTERSSVFGLNRTCPRFSQVNRPLILLVVFNIKLLQESPKDSAISYGKVEVF
jgi:hypothetical protein